MSKSPPLLSSAWLLLGLFLAPFATADEPAPERARTGLLALYDFHDAEGARIADRSGLKPPLDLAVGDPKAVRREPGELTVTGRAAVVAPGPARRLSEAVKRSGAITIEAWVRPAKPDQSGPARIVTLSSSTSARNFTLGQDGGQFDVRLRTTKTDNNGNPSLKGRGRALTTKWTHVVYTREKGGRTKLYLDGREDAAGEADGDLSNWDSGMALALGDEPGRESRLWLGSYRLVALYGRALTPAEVAGNFGAGPGAGPGGGALAASDAENERRFHEQIAPILAKHCLECHDTANREGELDLSKRDAALASKSIVPGKPDESELWGMVLDDEMPEDRSPLNPEEKAALEAWIAAGAHWPAEEVDPLAHKRDRRAAQTWVRRLTVPEYIATVRDSLGVDVSKEALEILPPDLRADGFSNTAYNLGVDLGHVEAYARLAEIAAGRLDKAAFAKRFSRSRKFTDKDMEALIRPMGRWLLRGPLTEDELVAYRGISTAVASAGGSFDEAVGLIVEAMMQSPRFLYLVEEQRGDGGRWPLDAHALAGRMSYLLWGAPPDEELLRAADKGELASRDGAARQVGRMLKDPRAVARSLQFAADWLHLDRLREMAPNKTKYPNWTPALAEDMRAETLAFFEDIAWRERRPLHELLNAQRTHLTPRLARHYGIDPPAAGAEDQLVPVSLGSEPARGGLLTQGSILTIGGDDASMVTRGLFVMHDLLRSGVKDPPPGTDTTPVPSEPGLPQRKISEMRINDKSCGGCHSKFEPLAFGLERFDGLGGYSEIDRYGNRLRQDGAVLFPGEAEPVPYEDIAELMDLLAESERVRESITWKYAQFALGRPIGGADEPLVKAAHAEATQAGFTFQALAEAIALSDLVRTVQTVAE